MLLKCNKQRICTESPYQDTDKKVQAIKSSLSAAKNQNSTTIPHQKLLYFEF